MDFGFAKRTEWEFEYTASTLAAGAVAQKAHRLSRVKAWTEAKAKVMAEIRESGIQVSESIAAGMVSYANTVQMALPQVGINPAFQQKLGECHEKIQRHTAAAAEYDGWVQVLAANPEARLKLTQVDWLYFFGKI